MENNKPISKKGVEKALKKKMKQIGKISDPGERLMQYAALRTACRALYNEYESYYDNQKRTKKEMKPLAGIVGGIAGILGGEFAGFGVGAAVGTALGWATFFGVAVAAPVTLVAAAPVATALFYKTRTSKEQRYATRMETIEKNIAKAMNKLMTDDDCIERLGSSPRFDDVVKLFPEVKGKFNNVARYVQAREKFMIDVAPEQKALPEAKPQVQLPAPKNPPAIGGKPL